MIHAEINPSNEILLVKRLSEGQALAFSSSADYFKMSIPIEELKEVDGYIEMDLDQKKEERKSETSERTRISRQVEVLHG